jgi:hypothetical protein
VPDNSHDVFKRRPAKPKGREEDGKGRHHRANPSLVITVYEDAKDGGVGVEAQGTQATPTPFVTQFVSRW